VNDFTHLHCHTQYSPLDGVCSPDELFDACVKMGFKAVAVTEHGNMASVPDSYFASKRTGIKYIAGYEAYYNDYEKERQELVKSLIEKGKKVKDLTDEEKATYNRHRHLLVICKNQTGYRNALRIRKKAYLEGFYRKPRMSFEMLKEFHEGLIIGSGCMNGPVSFELLQGIRKAKNQDSSKIIMNQAREKAIRVAYQFKKLLKDDFYIELQMPGIEDDVELFRELAKIAKLMSIKCIITNDSHYIEEKDYLLQKVMMAIDQDVPINSPELFISKSSSGYLKSREELRKNFCNHYQSEDITIDEFEKACDNTMEIADKCEGFKPDLNSKLPVKENANVIIRELTTAALKDRGLDNEEYNARLNYELGRIIKKDFSSYFLICRELVSESLKQGMPVGPRGSAGGSLVCYLLDIHDVDPIKASLSFDRFLSSSRGGWLLQATMDKDELEE
jgi:DNA polymerase-3 subunit alpha